MMTWDDYIMIHYDVMNLCYFYVVFRKKRSQIWLSSIFIQLLFYDSTLFFNFGKTFELQRYFLNLTNILVNEIERKNRDKV